jgi:hypothetical protein
MQQTTIRFDEALQVQQPVDVMAPARKTVQVVNRQVGRAKSAAIRLSARALRIVSPWQEAWQAWAAKRSETFTGLCGSEGDVFTHGDVVKAHLALAAVLILIGIGGAL